MSVQNNIRYSFRHHTFGSTFLKAIEGDLVKVMHYIIPNISHNTGCKGV